jgi:hypothetical protein
MNANTNTTLLVGTLLVVSCALPLKAQTQSAAARGVIQDATGRAVSTAKVALTSVTQRRSWSATTNESGIYSLVQIPPGEYDLSVEAQGFKKFERRGLTLQVAQIAEIDISLEIGAVTETVTVTAQAPLLESGTSTLGEVVNARTTESLPLNGRNILQQVQLIPGVNSTPVLATASIAMGNTNSVAFNINGGRNVSNMILVDGSPQETPNFNEPAYVPSPDAVQEFKVQTNTLPAEYGRTAGGIINILHRSGTRDFHGTLYEFFRNDKLDANNFFSNRNRVPRPPFRFNQFGLTFGGPLTPSRQTTFFFFNYEGLRQVNPGATTYTVPTGKMKQGDFSELTIPIYDPQTVDASGQRQQFTGNVIPTARLDPVGLKLVSYYPTPTRPGIANNFFSSLGSRPKGDVFSGKIDRRLSENHNIFGRISWYEYSQSLPNDYGNVGSRNAGSNRIRTRSITIDDTYVKGSWAFNVNAGWAYFANPEDAPPEQVLPSSLGFPRNLDSVAQFHIFPRIEPSGYSELGGNTFWIIRNAFETYNLNASASRVLGKHTIKFGGTHRLNRVAVRQPISPSGQYAFDNAWTRSFFNRGTGGDAIASMLLGLPAAGEFRQEPFLSTQVRYIAFYLQDDWRVTSRLTVNMGLRWDSDRPLTERFDRASWFDPAAVLPIQVPGIGQIRGGVVFPGRDSNPRGIRNSDNNNFAPRLGLAYRITNRLLIRTGGGIMYTGISGDGPSSGRIGAVGFNARNTVNSSLDGGRTPFATLSDPFPRGLVSATNGSEGLLTSIGTSLPAIIRSDRIPYLGQWNFDLQYELPHDSLIDIAYAGNVGVKLLGTDPELNQLPDQYLALGDALSQSVANPFFGIIPATQPLGGATTTRGQLLRPFPQYLGVAQQKAAEFHSSYHALQIKMRQRYRGGVQFLAAYTWSKLIDNVSSMVGFLGQPNPPYTNNNRKDLDRSISALDIAHRLVFNYEWELPFGQGKRFALRSAAMNHLFGGWSLNGVTTLQTGLPISVTSRNNTTNSFGGTQRPNSTGISSKTPGSPVERIDGWFNRAAFADPPPFTFGNVGRHLPDNRGPGLHNWDLSVLKNVALSERMRLQFRGEFFNLFNHTNFRNPVFPGTAAQFGQPAFGTITLTYPARSIQLGLKLLF